MGLYTLFDSFASLSVLKSNNYATSFLNIKTKKFYNCGFFNPHD